MRKWFILFLFVVAIFWATGLFWFAAQVNRLPQDTETQTDALIVLTGGTERVSSALDLLKQNKAAKLLISGVNKKVDWVLLAQTVDELPDGLGDKVTLGHVACNTRQNALESKNWLERNRFKSVRLVTASYHMPRSLSEFRNVMPDMTIIPHPIFPHTVKHDEWWKWKGTFTLIILEYTKFLFVTVKHFLPFAKDSFNAETVCEQ